MSIKVLGPEKITNPSDFMTYGIMKTPGLVVNEEVKSSGKVLSKEQAKILIEDSYRELGDN